MAGIRISIHKDFWGSLRSVTACPTITGFEEEQPDASLWPRIIGTIKKWAKKGEQLRVHFYDGDFTYELSAMAVPEYNLRLEKYEDGRDPPRGRGDGARGIPPAVAPAMTEVTFTSTYSSGAVDQQLVWKLIDKDGVRVDARTEPRFKAQFKVGSKHVYNTEYKMVKAFIPPKWLARLTKYLNQRLDGARHKTRKTTEGECERFMWYMVALAINRGVPLNQAWSQKRKGIVPPLGMGDFGMGSKRFELLRKLFGQAYDTEEEGMDPTDPYRYARFWVDEYNEHMNDTIVPSWMLAPDESMSQYKPSQTGVSNGQKVSDADNIPSLDFLPRKPEPLGKELKTLCDGDSGIFLAVEIQEGKERHCHQEWYDEWGHTTAQCLRLVKPWLKDDKERVFVADSWFSGVRTSEALWTLSSGKMFSIGDVKTNSGGFPKIEFANACPPGDGEWATFQTVLKHLDHPTLTQMDLYGVVHRRGGGVHTYIFNCGQTLAGKNMHHDLDDAEDDEVKLGGRPCPKVLNDYTKGQPWVDVGNMFRQHELGMEKRFPTTSWPFRLFTTMWGIVLASAAQAFHYFHPTSEGQTFIAFCTEAANQGVYCDVFADSDEAIESDDDDEADSSGKRRASSTVPGSRSPKRPNTGAGSCSTPGQHTLAPISTIRGFQGSFQQLCGVCKVRCGTYCVQCSSTKVPQSLVPVHLPEVRGVKYKCFKTHLADPGKSAWAVPKVKARKRRA